MGLTESVPGEADCTYRLNPAGFPSMANDTVVNPPFVALWKYPTVSGFYSWFDKPTGVFDYAGDMSSATTTEYPASANLAGGQEAFRIAQALDPSYNTQPEMDYYLAENKSNPQVAFLVAPYTGERLNVGQLLNNYYSQGTGVFHQADEYFSRYFLHIDKSPEYSGSGQPAFNQSLWAAAAPAVSNGATADGPHLFINPSGSQPSYSIVLPDGSTYTNPPSCQQVWSALPASVQQLPSAGAAGNIAIVGQGYDYEYYANSAADFCAGGTSPRYQAWTKAVYAQGCAAGGNIDAKSCAANGYASTATPTVAAVCAGVTAAPAPTQTFGTQAYQTAQIAKLTAALGATASAQLVSTLGASQAAGSADSIIAGEALIGPVTASDYLLPGDGLSNYTAGVTPAQLTAYYLSHEVALYQPPGSNSTDPSTFVPYVPGEANQVLTGYIRVTLSNGKTINATNAQQIDPFSLNPTTLYDTSAGKKFLAAYNQSLAMQKGGCWPPVATTVTPVTPPITPPITPPSGGTGAPITGATLQQMLSQVTSILTSLLAQLQTLGSSGTPNTAALTSIGQVLSGVASTLQSIFSASQNLPGPNK